jgi:ApaG protein
MYQAVTRNIEVTVTPQYLPERSSPESNDISGLIRSRSRTTVPTQFSCAPGIGASPMRPGRRQEVKGAGVVGKQPVLKPGESFEYTSGVPLPTPPDS